LRDKELKEVITTKEEIKKQEETLKTKKLNER